MNNEIRTILATPEFLEYYNSLPQSVITKYDYVIHIMKSQKVVNIKFVKSLEHSNLYEMRVSVGSNEYRTILFTFDSNSFIECSKVILLNSFLKKSTKQYKSEIAKANKILTYLEESND